MRVESINYACCNTVVVVVYSQTSKNHFNFYWRTLTRVTNTYGGTIKIRRYNQKPKNTKYKNEKMYYTFFYRYKCIVNAFQEINCKKCNTNIEK